LDTQNPARLETPFDESTQVDDAKAGRYCEGGFTCVNLPCGFAGLINFLSISKSPNGIKRWEIGIAFPTSEVFLGKGERRSRVVGAKTATGGKKMFPWTEIRDFLFRPIVYGGLSALGGLFVGWVIGSCKEKRLRRKLAKLAEVRGEAEVVLIVSNRERIRPAVERHLKDQGKEKILVFEEHRDSFFSFDLDDWDGFLAAVKKKVRQIRQYAPTRILLFTNVPVAMAVGLGAILDNGPEVWVHHYFNGLYQVVVLLSHETVAPREEVEFAREAESVQHVQDRGAEENST